MTTTRPAFFSKKSNPKAAQKPSSSAIFRSYQYLRPYWKMAAGAMGFLVLNDTINILNPQLIAGIIDHGIKSVGTPGGQQAYLAGMVGLLLGLTLIKGVLTFFQERWAEVGSQNVASDLRAEIQRNLTALSFSYHDKTSSGDLLSRTIQDVERIRFLTGRATYRILEATLMLTGTTLVLFWMNPLLAALAVLSFPLLVYRAISFGRRYRPLSLVIQQELGALTSRIEQNLRGARVVKAFAREPQTIAAFEVDNERLFDMNARAARMDSINVPLLNLIANISAVVILAFGGMLVVNGRLSLGELVAFTTYLAQLIQPVRRLGMILPMVSMAGAAGDRIFEVIDSVPEVKDVPDARPLLTVRGAVQFENVSFAYARRHEALSQLNFEAQPGQVIALLGQTGSGKSTVINLIPRFYDPTGGRVLIDGIDIRGVQLNSLRSQIGIVMQETTLFAASIAENISFGKPGSSREQIEEAARAAQAHEFILQTPHGYDSHVGERGVTLSGGQKQRLAIARAILTDPRILILDDATSSVDSETEKLIQAAMERLMIGRTTFVIAHRLSTLHKADLILVMEKGRIVARGTHATLLSTSHLYADIYQRQMRVRGAQ
jgi:ATP-binding cassette, subfamily B, multidrug efflux pump